jgi:DNA polymerase-3 subunit alpha
MFGSLDLKDGGLNDLFDLPDIDEWNEKEKLRKEKEALGFYITGHPLAGYSKEIERFATCPIQDLPAQKDKSVVKIACVVESLKMKRTRKGDKMAILSLEDLTGSTEAVVFPDVFNRTAPILKGDEPLLITGSAEIGDSTAKIIAQEIVTLDSIRQKAVKAIELNLSEESVSKEVLEDLQDIAFKYPGECKLVFKVQMSNGKEVAILANPRFNVLPTHELIAEIEALIGNEVHKVISENAHIF